MEKNKEIVFVTIIMVILSSGLSFGFYDQAFAQVVDPSTGFSADTGGSVPTVVPQTLGNTDVSTLGATRNSFCNSLLFDNSNHQRYFPGANSIAAVDIELVSLNLASASPITVNLYQGFGIGGPLLGSTSNDDGNYPAVAAPPAIVHFDFGAPITLVPNDPYTIEITINDGSSDFQWQATLDNPLPVPQDVECFSNIIVPDIDFIFATYFPVTVGGSDVTINTSALLLAGVQSISMWMIPVVIAGIGIGVFVIKKRK